MNLLAIITIILAFIFPTAKCLIIYLIFRYNVKHIDNYVENKFSYGLFLSSAHIAYFLWWIANIVWVIVAINTGGVGAENAPGWLSNLITMIVEWALVYGFTYLTVRLQENYAKNKFYYGRLLTGFNYGLSIYFIIRFIVFTFII